MVKLVVEFEVDELRARLTLLKRDLRNELKLAILEAVTEGVAEARRIVPKDTKNLMKSIQFRIEDQGFRGIYGTAVEYGPFVEFGTTKQAPQPYITPSFEKVNKDFQRKLRQIAGKV